MNHAILVLAQMSGRGGSGPGAVASFLFLLLFLIALAFTVLMIASMWKIFTKAGQPGWASLIPIYNSYVWCKIAGKPGWWCVLFIIPLVSFIVFIIVSLDIARAFGQSSLFTIGMILLPFICYPVLAFGDAEYQGPQAA